MGRDADGRGLWPGENRILAALPDAEQAQLFKVVRNITLPVKAVLFEPGDAVEAVHFPLNGVVSLVTPLQGGTIVEVATIGNEGIVGVPLVSHGGLAVRAISQVAGHSLRMEASVFQEWFSRSSRLPDAGRQLHAGTLRSDRPGGCMQPPPFERGAARPVAADESGPGRIG